MDAPESSRRWRSHEWNVLVVIAIIAALGLGWLGWQVYTVRHRREMRAQIKAAGGVVTILGFETRASPFVPRSGIRPADRDYRIPEIRRLLGDGEIGSIQFDRRLTSADRAAIEAFPEAEVLGIPDPPAATGAP